MGGLIRTVENDQLSLFMSAVADMAQRQKLASAPAGATTALSPGQRPGLEHPWVLAATVFAELKHDGKPVPDTPPPEVAAALGPSGSTVWRCIRLAGELMLAKIAGDALRVAQLEGALKDSECDPGWSQAMTAYLAYYGTDGRKRSIPYVRFRSLDDFVYDVIPKDATIALIGDWGTGMGPAERLMEQVAARKPDVVVHLGDIYYAGTASEVNAHFVDVLDRIFQRKTTRLPVYAMPGNHEMYSGAAAYYDMIGRLNAPPLFEPRLTQKASYFSLRSEDGAWQLLAMDTALHDYDPFQVVNGMTLLEPDELLWHVDKIERFHAQRGRTILLSHHQLFSGYATIGRPETKLPAQQAFNTNLLNAFRTSLEARKITAWFWGHEHTLSIYQPYPPLDKGRCVGHGAIPVLTSQQPYRPLAGLPNPPALVKDPNTGRELQLSADGDGVYDLGYVLIRLRSADGSAEVTYYQSSQPDQPLYTEVLS